MQRSVSESGFKVSTFTACLREQRSRLQRQTAQPTSTSTVQKFLERSGPVHVQAETTQERSKLECVKALMANLCLFSFLCLFASLYSHLFLFISSLHPHQTALTTQRERERGRDRERETERERESTLHQ